MLHNMGTLLILLSAAITIMGYYKNVRHRKNCLEETIWALEHISSEIRFRHRPLPSILQELQALPNTGKIYGSIIENMAGTVSLHDLWGRKFSSLEKEIAEVMTRVDLSGDEKHITDGLSGAVQELRRVLETLEQEKAQRGRLVTALSLCGAGLLVILLM